MAIPDNIIVAIRSRYSRPPHLSDPWADFTPEELEAIIRKRDAELTDCDLRCIFQSILPAGEYTECVWFLPLALERMLPPAGDADLCFDVFSWIGDNAEPLAQDGLWDELLAFTEKFFAELTAAFILKNGYPENLGHVDQLIEALNDDRGAFDGMGDRLIQKYLAVADTYPRAAWLITLLEHTLYYSTTSKYLKTVARENRTPMKNAYDTIVAAVADDDELLNYWSGKFDRLAIW